MSRSRAGTRWLDWLWPDVCLGCEAAAPTAKLGLCRACARRLREAPGISCRGCGRALPTVSPRRCCPLCAHSSPPLERLCAGWLYQPPCDRVLAALKFRGLDYLGAELGAALAQRFSELSAADAVVPVPLHWRRRLVRGYNQAERIARPFAAALGLPLVEGLRRRVATRRQTSLARGERLRVGTRTFSARLPAVAMNGARLLLVDDVFTTGATLRAAATALLEGGAAAVVGLVAARVCARGEPV